MEVCNDLNLWIMEYNAMISIRASSRDAFQAG